MTPSTELKVSNLLFYAQSARIVTSGWYKTRTVYQKWMYDSYSADTQHREPVSAARDNKQDDPHYSAGPRRYLCLSNLMLQKWEGFGTNEAEWIGKLEKEKFQAVGEACKAIFWPAPGSNRNTFDSSRFLTDMTSNICDVHTNRWGEGGMSD